MRCSNVQRAIKSGAVRSNQAPLFESKGVCVEGWCRLRALVANRCQALAESAAALRRNVLSPPLKEDAVFPLLVILSQHSGNMERGQRERIKRGNQVREQREGTKREDKERGQREGTKRENRERGRILPLFIEVGIIRCCHTSSTSLTHLQTEVRVTLQNQ